MKPDEEKYNRCLARAGDPASVDQPLSAHSVRKFVMSELTDDDLRDLGFAACPAKPVDGVFLPNSSESDASGTSRMLDVTMKVIADQINNVGLEAEMLALRKRALKRRLRILERLSKPLGTDDDNQKSQ